MKCKTIKQLSKCPSYFLYLIFAQTQIIYESLALVDYVEDRFQSATSPSIYVKEGPTLRALARIIISRYDSSLIPLWYEFYV